MRAIVLTRHGGPDVLRVIEVPKPEPREGEMRVRIRVIGVNFAEVLSRRGVYGWAPRLPYILGMEAFGEVEETGEQVIVGTQFGGASAAAPRTSNPLAKLAALRNLPRPAVFDMLVRSYGIMSFHVGHLLDSGAITQQWRDLVQFTEAHGIRPVIGQRFPFDQMPDAHRALEERRNVGKVVVHVS